MAIDVAGHTAPLKAKIRSAYAWTAALQVTRNLAGFGLAMLLARALDPKDYGLVGMVTVITGALAALQDSIGQAVVYFEDNDANLPTYFSVNTVIGVCLCAAAFFSAPFVAEFDREPRLVSIMHVVSVNFLFGSFRFVSFGLLSKRFEFRSLALVESGCLLGSGALAVLLAWNGFGVWSLVANVSLQTVASTMIGCWLVPPKLTLHPNYSVVKKVLRWGLPMGGASLLWQIYENADYFVIGRILGAAPLGQYTMAFRLATLANDKISSIINRVSFPSFVAMQAHEVEIGRHWFLLTRQLGWLNIPFLTILAMNSRELIVVLLGSKWLVAAPLVKFLCVVGALKSFNAVAVNMLCALGRTDLNFRFTLLNALLLPAGFMLGCKLAGIEGVGLTWCLIFPLTWGYLSLMGVRLIGLRLRDYVSNLLGPTAAGMVCAASMIVIGFVPATGLGRLVLRSTAAVACAGALFLSQPDGSGVLFTVRRLTKCLFHRSTADER